MRLLFATFQNYHLSKCENLYEQSRYLLRFGSIMNTPFEQSSIFDTHYRALVIGASGAIGNAFANAFSNDPNCSHVEVVSRTLNPGFDLQNEHSLQERAESCRAFGPYQIIVDATGALIIDGVGPEKSLSSLRKDNLTRNFEVNAVGPILMLRYFAPLLASGPSIYAKLSARVGSISDNKKGGWYGYRASKAALNMFLQTAAIELQRKNPELQVIALQPGTVRSALSQPFAASVPHLLEPSESVSGMLNALKKLQLKPGAQFIDYCGKNIEW
jgi:NAD(P)-dependent dehydrogenase (short-subunit alcohol dehydrogenase family)